MCFYVNKKPMWHVFHAIGKAIRYIVNPVFVFVFLNFWLSDRYNL